ncbi:hypothetical protein ACRBEV_03820 [Methylobacterium phyllosphaerae]
MTAEVDRHELRRIIAGLSEGMILAEPDQTIAYANAPALYRKIGIHRCSEAVVWGRENGFPLSPSDG